MNDTVLIPKPAREAFLEQLWTYYAQYGRHDLPWRLPEPDGTFDPYKILVSELMLQQTQVSRVVPKYLAFLERFPTSENLAEAPLGDVLRLWQGLGYNRRAKFLWQAAQAVRELSYFPSTPEELIRLPGVGVNTSGAIQAYTFNKPAIFIETNIRTVYIYHFLQQQESISDTVIRGLLSQTLDREHPREFYWALMDYGAWLKTQVHTNSQSRHYTRQTRFEGSRRQLRGKIIRVLTEKAMSMQELEDRMHDERLKETLVQLIQDGLIVKNRTNYSV